jgi:hypothetical protein
LGIDEEQVSSLESLHEDFYFDTLDFFNEVARAASGGDSSGSVTPGTVTPWIHPARPGEAPELTVTYSKFASNDPKLVVKYIEKETEEERKAREAKEAEQKQEEEQKEEQEKKDEREKTITRVLSPANVSAPSVYSIDVKAGEEGLARVGLLVSLADSTLLPRLAATLDNLRRLQEKGMFDDAVDIRGVGEVAIRLEAPGALSTRVYTSVPAERETVEPEPYTGEQLVTWDHVISPKESERIAHTLGTLPYVTTYVAGESYQGRPISVMELKMPMEAELVSQAKLNVWKPVLSIVGRQHANEVSSTSHILRLAELMATDPEYRKYLEEINVVIQPVVNPDGAALAYELQKITPTHMLHAARYSALGTNISGSSNRDTLLTESLVMGDVSRRWVADVSLNPHGYPSHEWVHQFANYNPKSFRAYWIPRGWYTNVRSIEDPRLRDYQAVALAMRDYIAEEVSKDSDVRETNTRIYDRYQRWAIRWQPHVYNLEVYKDTAVYYSRRGGGVSVASPNSLIRSTVFSGMTEAMDETAQGPWLDMVTRMGFGFLMASVRFLDEAEYELYRMEGESGGSVRIAVLRPRPIQPGREEIKNR